MKAIGDCSSSATSMAVRSLIGPDAAERILGLMREDGSAWQIAP